MNLTAGAVITSNREYVHRPQCRLPCFRLANRICNKWGWLAQQMEQTANWRMKGWVK